MVTRLHQSLIIRFWLLILFVLTIFFTGRTNAEPEQKDGPIGTSQAPLVTNTPPINAEEREKFGLLTLNTPQSSCSASMITDFWAITAAHCVFSPTTGVQFMPAQITLTADWKTLTRTAQVLRVVPYSFPFVVPGQPYTPSDRDFTPNDIAILQVGRHDFALPIPIERTLHDQRVFANSTVQAFGRGINQFAFHSVQVNTDIPSLGDGEYRSAQFNIFFSLPDNLHTCGQERGYPCCW